MRSVVLAMVVCGLAAMVQAQSPAPSIEEVEAQIKAAEEKQAAAEKALREAQTRRDSEAARKAETQRQERVERKANAAREREELEAAAAAAAQKGTLVIKTDTRCQLSINGENRGWLEGATTQRMQVEPGEQLIECNGEGRRVEQTASVDSGKQAVVQLVLLPKERFERVSEGIRDNEQNLIWAQADNGRDIDWGDASQYCVARGAGWSLPTSAALLSLYDDTGYLQLVTSGGGVYLATPLIALSEVSFWSREQRDSSLAMIVVLSNGLLTSLPVSASASLRAMCVHRS